MLNLSKIYALFGGGICRRCLNRVCHVNLERTDCVYGNPYPMCCPRCGEMHNIVTDLRFTGRIKLMFK